MNKTPGLTCGECGAAIRHDESQGRQPCPSCGSLVRHLAIVGNGGIQFSGSARTVAVTYAEALLDSAQRWLEEGEPSVAIIVLHTAVEVATSRAISITLRARGLGEIDDAIRHLVQSYDITNRRVRKLYEALTGDNVASEPFWAALVQSANRRNAAVHKGERFTQENAEEGLAAARALVSHLLSSGRGLGTPPDAA
jgi:hypothetical protein